MDLIEVWVELNYSSSRGRECTLHIKATDGALLYGQDDEYSNRSASIEFLVVK